MNYHLPVREIVYESLSARRNGHTEGSCSLCLLIQVIIDHFFTLLGLNDPVVVDVVEDFVRNGNLGVLLVIVVQEVLVVEDGFFGLLFSLLELVLLARLLGGLEVFPLLDGLLVLDLEGSIGILASFLTVLLTLLLFFQFSLALLLLQLGKMRAHANVASSRLDRQLDPAVNDGKSKVVMREALERVLSDQLLDVGETLVDLDGVRLGTLVLVLFHGRDELLHPQLLGALPEQLLRFAAVCLTDLAHLEAEQVEDGFEEVLVFDNLALGEALEALLHELVVLEEVDLELEAHLGRDILLLLDGLLGLLVFSLFGRSLLRLFFLFLLLLGGLLLTLFFDLIILLLALALLGMRVQSFFDQVVFLLADSKDNFLVKVDSVLGALLDKRISVFLKALLLELFPVVFELVHGLKDLRLLVVRELLVLTHKINANDKLAQFSDNWRQSHLGPLSDFRHELSASSLGLSLRICLLFLECRSLILDTRRFIVKFRQLVEGLLQAANRQRRAVHERNGDVGTETRHLPVVHAGLANNLWSVDVLEVAQ